MSYSIHSSSEVAYSVQTVVDAKHCIPIDYKVTNQNDAKGMYPMLRRTKTILNSNQFTAVYNKGCYASLEIKKVIDLGIDIMVAVPDVASNGKWYTRFRSKTSSTKVKLYKTTACMTCPASILCTENKKGRCLERPEYAVYVEQNKRNIEVNKEVYK